MSCYRQLLSYPRELPPLPILRSAIDVYFTHVHNQPYSFFNRDSFLKRLETDQIPQCLLFAVLVIAVRFSEDAYYCDSTRVASDTYSEASCHGATEDHIARDNNLNFYVIQTTIILAVEREEYRRTFWSVYMMDRLISCVCITKVDSITALLGIRPTSPQQMRPSTSWSQSLTRRACLLLKPCTAARPRQPPLVQVRSRNLSSHMHTIRRIGTQTDRGE